MKVQRQILGISQAKLAEKVDTSTNYIALIESERRFPSPEMLERIAAALEIDSPALFSTKTYPKPETGTLAEFHDQVVNDLSQILAYRIAKLNRETPPDGTPDADQGPQLM
jgi:transcriptional regulator with XRE-family HTH domain